MLNITKRLIVWTAVTALILSMLLIMQFSEEIQWNEAIAYSIILLLVGGFYELQQWLKIKNITYRWAFGTGLMGTLLLGWVSGAVGIIGSENNPANLLYWAVPAVMLIGGLISHLKPRGMSATLFATAIVHLLAPCYALFIWPAQTTWGEAGVKGVLIFNTLFSMIFFTSAFLFRKAVK